MLRSLRIIGGRFAGVINNRCWGLKRTDLVAFGTGVHYLVGPSVTVVAAPPGLRRSCLDWRGQDLTGGMWFLREVLVPGPAACPLAAGMPCALVLDEGSIFNAHTCQAGCWCHGGNGGADSGGVGWARPGRYH
jgi:hypothetical protein